ncbi:MAG: glycosyltransferase [Pseudomonadota bacterium]
MDHPPLPADIGRVLFAPDGVYIWANADAAPDLRLSVLGREYGVQRPQDAGRPVPEVPNVGASKPTFQSKFVFNPTHVGATPRVEGAPTKVTAMLNQLGDWKLDDHDTLQLCLEEVSSVTDIDLAPPVNLPASKTSFEVDLSIALHRCVADAVLTIEGEDGPPLTLSRPIDAQKFGGQARKGYCNLTFEVPASATPRSLRLSVQYKWSHGEQDGAPFIFVADAKVAGLPLNRHAVMERVLRGPATDAGDCVFAELAMAEIPPSAAVSLISPAGRAEILPAIPNPIELSMDESQCLALVAEQKMDFSIYLDGARTLHVPMRSEAKQIALPASVMTGEARMLTLKDGWGLRTYLQEVILLPRVLTTQDHMLRESKAPFPTYLSHQAVQRYDGLKRHLKFTKDPAQLEQIAWALEVLDGGHENVTLKPLAFETVKDPTVSVIVPAHNKVELTYLCLCALLLAHNEVSFEVIVVDDASSDETAHLDQLVSGITVLHHTEPQRFIRACNAGVAAARGDYVVLLNNDTEPTAGWLDALVDGFDLFADVGLVGSKLLYPNGQLQEAGGIVWDNGDPWNYGKFSNPWDPRFCYARQVDYVSGAALMTTKAIWDEVGGLSAYLEPMYFEDTDLAFKIRDAGYTTYFIPSSIVYHYEGMTSGTDVTDTSAFKSLQEVNRPKFKAQWQAAFEGLGTFGENPDLEKDRGIRGRVLFIDHTTPRADQDAGSYAAIQEMRIVQSLGYKVTFLPKNMVHMGSYTDALQRLGIEVVSSPFYRSTDDYLETHGREFDAFYITRYVVGQVVIDKIRQVAPEAKILFNNADLHFLREMRAALADKDPEKMVEVRKVRDEELDVMCKADLVLSYNEVEHAVITSHTEGQAQVVKAPWVVELAPDVPPFKGREGLAFLGNYRHPPNAEGVVWFVRDVMPLLATDLPDVSFSIYGAGISDELKALASDRVLVKGFVEHTSDAYDPHRIFVAPLLSGAGIKGKVIAALAQGTPTVLTPVAAEGIGLRNGLDCLIADTPQDTAAAITRLYDDAKLWRSLSDNARAYVEETFSFATGRKVMRQAFEAVDISVPID